MANATKFKVYEEFDLGRNVKDIAKQFKLCLGSIYQYKRQWRRDKFAKVKESAEDYAKTISKKSDVDILLDLRTKLVGSIQTKIATTDSLYQNVQSLQLLNTMIKEARNSSNNGQSCEIFDRLETAIKEAKEKVKNG